MTHTHAPVTIPNDPPLLNGCGYATEHGLCGKAPVAIYTNPFSRALNTARCQRHAGDKPTRRAEEMGYRRVPLVTPEEKAARLRAVERVEGLAL